MQVDTDWLVEFFRKQARLGFEEGDFTRVRNCCRGVLERVPTDVEAWTLLGEAALASHDSATAIHAFERLLELQPETAEHALRLGKAALQLQDWPAAIAALEQTLELQPDNAEALQALALVQQLQTRLQTLEQLPVAAPRRNDPCPCGSGLKYKKCCLAKSSQQLMLQRLQQAFADGEWSTVVSLADELPQLTAIARRCLALARYQLNQRGPAYPLIKQAISEFPDDLELRAAQADLELDYSLAGAKALAESVLGKQPENWRAALVLAACHARVGELGLAEQVLRQLINHNPDCDMAWQRLSHFLRKFGRVADDLTLGQQWAERCPQNAEAWTQWGMSLVMADHAEQARPVLQQALTLNANQHEAWCWLGMSFQNRKEPQQALGYLAHGLQLKPDYQAGWNMLGGVYQSVGRQHEAEGCFMRALAIAPDQAYAWNNLANTYLDALLLEEAERVMHVAIDLAPDEPNLWNNLGNILSAARRLKDAQEAYRHVLEVAPDYRPVLANLAGVESHFGNLDRAIELLRIIIDSPQAWTNILFFANYHPDWSGEQVFALYQEVAKRLPARRYFDYANALTSNRRLRIGYVSPDFRHHVCAQFIEPLLANHNKALVEVYAYSLVKREDQVTERFMGYVDHWRHCVGLSYDAIAEKIREDRIDILVDLAGHTGNNGLPVLALKPAPVQVSWWMGFAFGTGLKQVDYFLADEQMLPPGCESSFAERLWRMQAPAVAYQAPQHMQVEVTALPALSNGYVTFGTLTRPIRLNHRVIRVWAELLRRVPNAKLMLDSILLRDESLQQHYRALFEAQGVEPERLLIGCTSPATAALSAMDIGLDCFPHNSGTTLYESLWMGVPVVSLRDRPSMGRVGALILHGAGHDEWIADTEEQYIEKLVALASDLPKLAAIRAGLREGMLASPLCDAADFAKRMEASFQQMWQDYCAQGEQQ